MWRVVFTAVQKAEKYFALSKKQKNVLSETLEDHLIRKESDKVGLVENVLFTGEEEKN